MKVIFVAVILALASGCANHCRDPIIVVGVSGYHHNCEMECHSKDQPDGFECRCTRACSCVEKHPLPSR